MNYMRIFVGKQKVENKDYPMDITGDTPSHEIVDLVRDKVDALKRSGDIPVRSMIQIIKIDSSPNLMVLDRPLRNIVPMTDPLFIDVYLPSSGGTKRRKHIRKTRRRR